MNNDIPSSVVEADHRLEQANERSLEKLAKHRWHHTLDESNPDRVAIRGYARAVGRANSTIQSYVNGYAIWQSGDRAGSVTLSECIDRANMSGEKAAAIEAVAQTHGTTFKYTRERHGGEVRDVQQTARDRAERKGTSYAEEVEQVAQQRHRVQTARQTAAERDRANRSAAFIQLEGKLASAKGYLDAALRVAIDLADFNDDERDIIAGMSAGCRSLLALIDVKIAGDSDTDWDAELANLTGGAA